MDYNTSRNKLVIPEYGRNVQRMVEYAIGIEDREKRNELAKYIVRIMTQMHLSAGYFGDYTQKIWDHLFIISDFNLDVDSPFPLPDRERIQSKPESVEYSDGKIRYRTYGRNLEKIIEKAVELEPGEEKDALIRLIASNLKKAYLMWNSSSIDDGQIIKDLDRMSSGKLVIPEDYEFPSAVELIGKKKSYSNNKKSYQSKGRDQKSNYRKSGRTDNRGKNDNRQSKYSSSTSNYRKRSY